MSTYAPALRPDALHTWADSMTMHVYIARLDAEDRAYRATLTPEELLAYRVHTGELAETCPSCGAHYVVVEGEDHPDMVGNTYSETYTCCGHTDSWSDALEYRD